MTNGLLEAGATLKWVYDPDSVKVQKFLEEYQSEGVRAADSKEQIFQDEEVKLVAAACITSERVDLGIRVMKAGKDYFVAKAPFTTLEQLALIKQTIQETGRKYMVHYSERLQVESAVYAGALVKGGAIGKVIQVMGMGPHRLDAPSRPAWFFEKEKYGGILCDIGSHQIEQFLYYTGATDATITESKIGNYAHPEYPELDEELRNLAECYINEMARLKNYLDDGEQIRIWYSDAPYSICGFYQLCSILTKYDNSIQVVKLPQYCVRDNVIISYKNWGEIAAEEFAGFRPYEKKLSRQELRLYNSLWNELEYGGLVVCKANGSFYY